MGVHLLVSRSTSAQLASKSIGFRTSWKARRQGPSAKCRAWFDWSARRESGEAEWTAASSRFLRDGGGKLEHGFVGGLRSVYEDLEIPTDAKAHVDAVSVTNSKFGFHGLIDYIWLSPGLHRGMQRRLRLLTVADLRNSAACRAGSGRGYVNDASVIEGPL